MQIPLIKISMEVFREWKSSKLGIETRLRNRILIHQTCQEWSNPVAIQRQLQTAYMIPDNPLYCISRISSPFCSWLCGRLHLGLQVSHLQNGSNFVMLDLLHVNSVLGIWQRPPAPGMLTLGGNHWGECLWWRYLILFSCWKSLPCTVATMVLSEKLVTLNYGRCLHEKARSVALSAKAEIPFLTTLLLCTNIRGLSSKILLSGLSFLF